MKYLVPYFLISFFIFISCQKTKIADPKTDLAQIGQLSVEKQEFINRFRMSRDYAQTKNITPEVVVKFLDEYFIKNYLLVHKLLDDGIENETKFKRELEQIKKRAMTGMNGPLYQKVIPSSVTISEEEIRNLYNKNKYKLKISYLRLSSKFLADSLYEVLQKGANFAEIAKKYSLDIHTSQRGGEVPNYILPGTLSPEFENAVYGLKKGQISKPFYLNGWYNIIKIRERKPIPRKPYKQVRSELKRRLERFKITMIRNQYIDSLFIKYHFKINKALFPYIKKAFIPSKRFGQLKKDLIPGEKLNEPLATYDGGEFLLEQFIDAYNKSRATNRVPLRYDDEIENHIKLLATGDLMYKDGVNRGLLNDKQFKFLYNRMRLQRLEREAYNRYVKDKVEITDEELKNYYEQNKQNWKNQDFEKIKNFIRSQLMNQKIKEYRDKLVQQLKKKYDIVYNKVLIKEVADSLNKMKHAPKIRKF